MEYINVYWYRLTLIGILMLVYMEWAGHEIKLL